MLLPMKIFIYKGKAYMAWWMGDYKNNMWFYLDSTDTQLSVVS
jgi:hypothetical protein